MSTISITLSIIYIMSFVINYFFLRRAYKPNGRCENEKPESSDIIFVVLPVFNTIFTAILIVWLMWNFLFKQNKSGRTIADKFFGV